MNENFNKMENIMKDSSLSDMNRNIEFIKDIVSFFYGESKIVYELKTRKSKILKIKHIAIYICAKNLKLTLVQLGEKFNYDHSMIVHIKKKYEGYLEFDNELKKELADIEAQTKKFKDIEKFKNNLTFTSLPYELEIMTKDELLKEKRDRWHAELVKDVYMTETLNVLNDLTSKDLNTILLKGKKAKKTKEKKLASK